MIVATAAVARFLQLQLHRPSLPQFGISVQVHLLRGASCSFYPTAFWPYSRGCSSVPSLSKATKPFRTNSKGHMHISSWPAIV